MIHANKGQNTRINAMDAFKEGNVKVLVATDVAARGIDVAQVSHVINFDLPLIYEDYVHRIWSNRPGESYRRGHYVPDNGRGVPCADIERIIRMAIPRMPLPPQVEVMETPFDEQQAMLREIDEQRRKEDPTFLGAFHEKKVKNLPGDKAKVKRSGSKKYPYKRRKGDQVVQVVGQEGHQLLMLAVPGAQD